MIFSLKWMTNISSPGLLARTNALAAAITSVRLFIMLLLLSTRIAVATGKSSLLKGQNFLTNSVFRDLEVFFLEIPTKRVLPSRTVACRTTRWTSKENVESSGA